MAKRKHRTVLVPYTIEVDERILPLLREMWRLGLQTRYSCEGYEAHPMSAYIQFLGHCEGSVHLLFGTDFCVRIATNAYNDCTTIWFQSEDIERITTHLAAVDVNSLP